MATGTTRRKSVRTRRTRWPRRMESRSARPVEPRATWTAGPVESGATRSVESGATVEPRPTRSMESTRWTGRSGVESRPTNARWQFHGYQPRSQPTLRLRQLHAGRQPSRTTFPKGRSQPAIYLLSQPKIPHPLRQKTLTIPLGQQRPGFAQQANPQEQSSGCQPTVDLYQQQRRHFLHSLQLKRRHSINPRPLQRRTRNTTLRKPAQQHNQRKMEDHSRQRHICRFRLFDRISFQRECADRKGGQS